MFRNFLLLAACLLSFACSGSGSENGEGDDNGSGEIVLQEGKDLAGYVKYSDGTPARGVVVSDGYSCTATDKYGIYQLSRHADARYVFFSYPADCRIVVSESGVPDFFRKLPADKEGAVYQDFVLEKLSGPVPEDFVFFPLGDPQIKTDEHIARFRNETVDDLNRSIAAQDVPTVAVVLGDVGDGNPEKFGELAAIFKDADTPCFQVMGNHDFDGRVAKGSGYELRSLAAFEEAFNPVNYSFNFGQVHFVVMGNIHWEDPGDLGYYADILDYQLEWLRQDLQYVPATKAVYLCVHAPVRNRGDNRTGLMNLISGYADTRIFSGHTHTLLSWNHSDYGITEHIMGATCGKWWFGTICGDGAPNGYGIFDISGTKVTNSIYKAVRYDEGFQGRMYDAKSFSGWNNDTWKNRVVCNVWNSTTKDWKVELYENGVKTKNMIPLYSTPVKNDYDYSVYDWLVSLGWEYMDKVGELYFAEPDDPSSEKSVRMTDQYGNEFWQREMTTNFDSYVSYPSE